jgi:hypothetical protein
MTEEVKKSDSPQLLDSLKSTGFEEIVYWIYVARDKFHTEEFFKAIGYHGPAQFRGANPAIVAAPREPKSCDYNVCATWNLEDKDEIGIRIEYSVEINKREGMKQKVDAEDFMEWLGGFFKYESCQAHIHADFSYPLASRQSKFPLPLKTAFEGDAEIDGISVRLQAAPKGVASIKLLMGKAKWRAEVVVNKRIAFKDYSLYTDVQACLAVLSSLLEEKRQ